MQLVAPVGDCITLQTLCYSLALNCTITLCWGKNHMFCTLVFYIQLTSLQIWEVYIVLSTPTHLSEGLSYKLLFRLQFFIPLLSSENHMSTKLVIWILRFLINWRKSVFLWVQKSWINYFKKSGLTGKHIFTKLNTGLLFWAHDHELTWSYEIWCFSVDDLPNSIYRS